MIVLYNPISTSPGKSPLPLSLMSLAAVLESPDAEGSGKKVGEKVPTLGSGVKVGEKPPTPWILVDGNVVPDPAAACAELL